MAYEQKNNPYKVTSCGRRRNFMQGDNLPNERTEGHPFKKLRKTTRGKGRHFLHAKEGAGMTEAGRRAYKKDICRAPAKIPTCICICLMYIRLYFFINPSIIHPHDI